MSAYVVDKAHIDALVRVAIEGPSDRGPHDGWTFHAFYVTQDGETVSFDVRHDTADDIGRMLWLENVRSVEYRYPDTAETHANYPGPISFERDQAETYTFGGWLGRGRHLTAVETLKALSGFEYQACESPDWRETPAYAFCEALRDYAIGALPGYRDADWEVREPQDA